MLKIMCHRACAALALATAPLFAASAGQSTASQISAAQEPAVKLERFEVRTDRAEDDAYRVSRSATATKTETILLDIPEAITVVKRQQLDDQQMSSLGDVIR